ncbi:hypothetical protein P608_10310 [Comamonas thiooxydans]|uniref:Uncharacterized protein n=1 Tax=Comamonas thiooxydans TaxID=363952 RepID=A0A0E3C227_9BURK|nr:hypothetical protein P608_10310 [Comamonas thiooxydans]KGH13787.1 hypothetical protein P607_23925 [Comamonas thiooxydans]
MDPVEIYLAMELEALELGKEVVQVSDLRQFFLA